ncbi:hypothetical protein ACFW3D_36950 [Streptomyces sp. NPDC058864]
MRDDVRPVQAAVTTPARGRNIWLVGGGDLVRCFADHGQRNDLIPGIAPVTLGAGAPLLPSGRPRPGCG